MEAQEEEKGLEKEKQGEEEDREGETNQLLLAFWSRVCVQKNNELQTSNSCKQTLKV